jgi:hypothetical protein
LSTGRSNIKSLFSYLELGIWLADETLREVGASGRLEGVLAALDVVADHGPTLIKRLVVLPLGLLGARPEVVGGEALLRTSGMTLQSFITLADFFMQREEQS